MHSLELLAQSLALLIAHKGSLVFQYEVREDVVAPILLFFVTLNMVVMICLVPKSKILSAIARDNQ
jgi:hypothetical protein